MNMVRQGIWQLLHDGLDDFAIIEKENLHRQNTLLAEARDHLLPRLMRGEIEV